MLVLETTTTAAGIMRILFTDPAGRDKGPALFLDRDGVINEQVDGSYVTDWSQFHFVPGIPEALAALSKLGLPIIVVSNQACVGKGLMSRTTLEEITRRFVEILGNLGARVDAVYYCPHTPEDGCDCRKPKPGLLQQAARDWGSQLHEASFVGDSPTDLGAAQATGCRVVFFSRKAAPASSIPAAAAIVREAADILPAVCALLQVPVER